MLFLTDKAIKFLDDKGVKYFIHSHKSVRTANEAESELNGIVSGIQLKTIAVQQRIDSDKYILLLLVLRSVDRLDFKKLSRFLIVPRSRIKNATVEQLENDLGVEPGGVSPICFDKNIQIIFDENIRSNINSSEMITCGIGLSTKTLEIGLCDLIDLINPMFVNLSIL